MEYGRRLAVWGWGMMIALGYLVLFIILVPHLQGWSLALLVTAAIATIAFSTSTINRRHEQRIAAATTEPFED